MLHIVLGCIIKVFQSLFQAQTWTDGMHNNFLSRIYIMFSYYYVQGVFIQNASNSMGMPPPPSPPSSPVNNDLIRRSVYFYLPFGRPSLLSSTEYGSDSWPPSPSEDSPVQCATRGVCTPFAEQTNYIL